MRLTPPNAKPPKEALKAIDEADVIILGPGSLYTSIIPNLLVKDLTKAISRSKATKIYVVNVMTQPGETTGYSASDHVKAIVEHSAEDVIHHVIINDEEIPQDLACRYSKDGATPVICDTEKVRQMGYNVVIGHVINPTDVVRHSPNKLARVIMSLV